MSTEELVGPSTTKGSGRGTSLPFYTRLGLSGLLTYGAIMLFISLLHIPLGQPTEVVVFGILATPPLIIVALAWRFRGWLLLLGAVWAAVSMLFPGILTIIDMGEVKNFFTFGLMFAMWAGLLLGFTGFIVSFIQYRRGTQRIKATATEKRAISVLIVAIGVVMLGSAVVHVANTTAVSDVESAGAVVLDMKYNYFDPKEIAVSAGQPVRILVRNRDLQQRDIQIAELGVSLTLLPFSEGLIEAPALSAGTISITSNYSDQAVASLVVR